MKSLDPPSTDEVQTLTRYLLGQLSESERNAIEERSLTEPALSETLAAIETELIDAWARGELPPDEHRLVEEVLLASPAQRERVRNARTLHAARSVRSTHRSTWWLAAAAVLIVATIGWFLRPRDEVAPPVARVIEKPASAVIPTLTLAAGVTRSNESMPRITIPKEAMSIRLIVELLPGDDEHAFYAARVQTLRGALVAGRGDLRVSRAGGVAHVVLEIPPPAPGPHELLLEADGELIAQHVFDVAM